MYSISKYLLDKISEIGIRHIFGTNNKYSMKFINSIMNYKDILWCNTKTDLAASYAANGYSKVNGIAAMLTSYGSSEMLAIDGVINSYFEDTPIINIVSCPWIELMMNLSNNNFKNSEYSKFKNIYENTSIYSVWLDNKNAWSQINEAIKYAIFYKKPVYILIPNDIMDIEVQSSIYDIDFSFFLNNNGMNDALNHLKNKLTNSKCTTVICGSLINSYGINKFVEEFINTNNLNFVCTPYSKGVLSEQNNKYFGIFDGKKTYDQNVLDLINNSDFIIKIGSKTNEFNLDKLNFEYSDVFEIGSDYIFFNNKYVSNISMGAFLSMISKANLGYKGLINKNNFFDEPFTFEKDKEITYDRLFQGINSTILENDIIISDNSIIGYATQDLILKNNCKYIVDSNYNSLNNNFFTMIGVKKVSNKNRVLNICSSTTFYNSLNELTTLFNLNIHGFNFVINKENEIIDEYKVNMEQLLLNIDPNKKKHEYFKITTEKELYQAIILFKNLVNKIVFAEIILKNNDLPKQYKKLTNK